MTESELSEQNFKRISIINWLLCLPLIMFFAWPYLYVSQFMEIANILSYIGAIFFAIPFMITILHGHVTMAIGEAHRHHYYNWLSRQPLTYGLLFHSVMMRTRFRLVLLIISMALFLIGYFDGILS